MEGGRRDGGRRTIPAANPVCEDLDGLNGSDAVIVGELLERTVNSFDVGLDVRRGEVGQERGEGEVEDDGERSTDGLGDSIAGASERGDGDGSGNIGGLHDW